jgi:hypothetical protein
MTRSRPALAALGLAVGLALALPGCGKNEPPKPSDKKDEKPRPDTAPGSDPSKKPDGTAGTPSAGTGEVKPTDPAQTAAEKFVKDFRDGTIRTEELSPAFLKVVGLPIGPFESDKARGYSTDAAARWFRDARGGLGDANFGVPTGYAAPGVAVFTGNLQPKEKGHYLLRLVQDGAAWKLDWFQVVNLAATDPRKPQSPDEPFQDFAARAFIGAVADRGAMSADARVVLAGALITPKYRAAVGADPGNQDKAAGYDYNRGWLKQKLPALLDEAEGYTLTPTGPGTVRVALRKGGATKPFTLELVKGTAPGQWLVDGVLPK